MDATRRFKTEQTARVACQRTARRRRKRALRRVISESVSEKELHQWMRSLYKRARGRDNAAGTLLMNYLIGKPTPAPDPDADDLHEWGLRRDGAVPMDELNNTTWRLPVDLASELVGIWRPWQRQFVQNEFRAGMTRPMPSDDGLAARVDPAGVGTAAHEAAAAGVA